MSMPRYEYPTDIYPNASTRQIENGLQDGRLSDVVYNQPSKAVGMNAYPNVYQPQGTIPVPGEQVFGKGRGYEQWPENQDLNHRNIRIVIDDVLLYRQNLGTPRHESRAQRLFASGPTVPQSNSTFIDGKRGDVYGT